MISTPIATAARLLRENAEELKQAHTLAGLGEWPADEGEVKATYDEHIAVAAALEAMPAQCLHQIQEPAAAEQAAWHAGLDEGWAQAAQPSSVSNAETPQAAPAAVAVPDELKALSRLEAACDIRAKLTTPEAYKAIAACKGMMPALEELDEARRQARAALAATPAAVDYPTEADPATETVVTLEAMEAWHSKPTPAAAAPAPQRSYVSISGELKPDVSVYSTPAAAPGKLDDDMQMRCRKCGEQVTIEFNSARIVTHNPHTGKPRDARDMASDPEGKLIVAPGPLFAAAAPVVLPEPVATIYTMEALAPGGAVKYHTQVHKALPSGTKLLAEPDVCALLAQAVEVDDHMALAFHHAITDGAIGQDELNEIKTGLRAVLVNLHAPQARDAEITWPKARDVGRIGDMSQVAHIRVGFDSDNDVFVSVWDENGGGSIEFCNPGGGGGGQSSRTRLALIALMVAMEADNAEKPSRDWWAQRTQAANGGDKQ